jgi:hypothetical protein
VSEKRKRLDLDEVRSLIELEREEREQERVGNAEKIANKVVECIANRKADVRDGKMRVRFSFWNRTMFSYDDETVQAVLRANGLRLETTDEYDPYNGRGGLKWGFRPFGIWFEVTVGLFEFVEESDDAN